MAKPKKCISPRDAEKLFSHWSNTRGKALENHLGEDDTCEFVLKISELREYLDYVEDESKKQRIENPAVRLYFAAYDNTTSDKATIFLAPTEGEGSDAENNYKIDPWNVIEGGRPPRIYNP